MTLYIPMLAVSVIGIILAIILIFVNNKFNYRRIIMRLLQLRQQSRGGHHHGQCSESQVRGDLGKAGNIPFNCAGERYLVQGTVAFSSDTGDRMALTMVEQLVGTKYQIVGYYDMRTDNLTLNKNSSGGTIWSTSVPSSVNI